MTISPLNVSSEICALPEPTRKVIRLPDDGHVQSDVKPANLNGAVDGTRDDACPRGNFYLQNGVLTARRTDAHRSTLLEGKGSINVRNRPRLA